MFIAREIVKTEMMFLQEDDDDYDGTDDVSHSGGSLI